jgi:hypothetical protein
MCRLRVVLIILMQINSQVRSVRTLDPGLRLGEIKLSHGKTNYKFANIARSHHFLSNASAIGIDFHAQECQYGEGCHRQATFGPSAEHQYPEAKFCAKHARQGDVFLFHKDCRFGSGHNDRF